MPDQLPLQLRSLQAHDLDALLTLYRQLNVHDAPLPEREEVVATWAEIAQQPGMQCLGGFLGEQLVCTCVLAVLPNLTRGCRPYALIENVVTHSAFRRRGYGVRLLRYAQQIAWAQRCYKVMLLTGRRDEGTLCFYESAGFDRHTKQAFYAANSAAY